MKWLALSLLVLSGAARADADDWSGFYGGLGVGAIKAHSTWNTDATLGTPDEKVDHTATDPALGGQFGYRAAVAGPLRLGFEVAFHAARIEKTTAADLPASFPNRERTTRIHDPLSIALQLGLAGGSQTFFYARGGWAYANIELQAKNNNVGNVALWE